METKKRKISTQKLEIGMYVVELDRPWEGTPFMFQGITIKSRKILEKLQELCKDVYIDDHYLPTKPASEHSYASPDHLNVSQENPIQRKATPIPKATTEYEVTTPIEKEIKVAAAIQQDLSLRLKNIFDTIKQVKKISFEQFEKPIEQMIDSIIRNPNACLRMTTLKNKDSYSYNHCMDMSILNAAFGRHLGLAKDDLVCLAWGSLFCDMGKVNVPTDLLKKPGRLSEDEFELIKKHIDYSAELLQTIKDIPRGALDIVLTHHERFDGSGYPKSLKGTEIPVFGRMACIVDTYDAITNNRPYANAISPHEAIKTLYEWRGTVFQEELIEAFIQCIGVYPIGTLVELNTGQVGIVVAQNRVRHLRPTIMLILDPDKIAYKSPKTINLMTVTTDNKNEPFNIEKILEPNAYGISQDKYYLGFR